MFGSLGLSADWTVALDVCVYSNKSPCSQIGDMFNLLAVGLRKVDQETETTFPNCDGFLAEPTHKWAVIFYN